VEEWKSETVEKCVVTQIVNLLGAGIGNPGPSVFTTSLCAKSKIPLITGQNDSWRWNFELLQDCVCIIINVTQLPGIRIPPGVHFAGLDSRWYCTFGQNGLREKGTKVSFTKS